MSDSLDKSALRNSTLYFDCATGLAGDMTLAALLDLGVPETFVRSQLSALPLTHWELRVCDVKRHGLCGKKVDVLDLAAPEKEPFSDTALLSAHPAHLDAEGRHVEEHATVHAAHTHFAQIRALLIGSPLVSDVKQRALRMFERLAEVESALHGTTVDQVAFHEVGALDSIVDIVGVAAALSWIAPARVVSRAVPVGHGRVRTAHGFLPVPAPATAALLKNALLDSSDLLGELTTPTGALILSNYAESFGPMPSMQLVAVGYGAGTRELPDRPNMLRIFAGHEAAKPQDRAEQLSPSPGADMWEIATNVDDTNPQLWPPLLEALLSHGANDVWLSPASMKKGRPGVVLHVLCEGKLRQTLCQMILRETSSLGVRFHRVQRQILEREMVSVDLPGGGVQIKLGRDPVTKEVLNVAPEFDTVVQSAKQSGQTVKQVYAQAISASAQFLKPTREGG